MTALDQPNLFDAGVRFDGATYLPFRDDERLTGQLKRIWQVVRDQEWHTLPEIAARTGDGEASISAQLRHLRKERFGSHTVEREHVERGLFRYRVLINNPAPSPAEVSSSGETRKVEVPMK